MINKDTMNVDGKVAFDAPLLVFTGDNVHLFSRQAVMWTDAFQVTIMYLGIVMILLLGRQVEQVFQVLSSFYIPPCLTITRITLLFGGSLTSPSYLLS